MRLLAIPLLLFVAGSAKVCDSGDKASAAAPASASASVSGAASAAGEVKATLPAPRIGGTVASAGEFSIELAAHASGLVEALVADAHGALLNEGVKLTALLQAKGQATEKVELAFSVPRARFEGHAKAGVELVPGPVDITLEVAGKVQSCKLSAAVILPEPRFGGQLVAVGDFSVELVAKGQEISAFVVDASGKAHAAGDLDLKLAVGTGADLALKWDAPSLSYVGRADANVNLTLEPIRVSLTAAGKAFIGGIASLSLAAKANAGLKANIDVDASAKLGAAAKAKLDAAAKAQAKLEAAAQARLDASAKKSASASVKLTPPKVEVSKSGSASAGAKAGGGAKASGGIHIGL